MKTLRLNKVIALVKQYSSCYMDLRNINRISIMIAMVLFCVGESNAQLKIYYIRHAEGGHNVRKNWETYSEIPKDKWPAYVGNPNMFTPMGKGQLNRVAGKLKSYKFDFIASSPIWRTRNTILPYMIEVGAKGEVWPELCEYWQSELIISSSLPTPTVNILGEGAPIELPSEETPYFSLREDGLNEIKLPPFPKNPQLDNLVETAASQLVIQHVLDMIQERFGGTDKSILLAGHGFSGKGILRMLTKDTLNDLPAITNAGIWMVEEQPNGVFKLMMFNDVPLENIKTVSVKK
ncbi:histidine phosphatase family protein [Formosa sp. PL04]|uniref:histidine phosphatase family protein n=1 Tax=Formosa sp. PL04 TaxID=3081755 RepID=UPI0029819712|nr:histidine phosphatase family protein [Formosa sp. PL04]MDW5290138.1 histidine phosphatase family protein [Formosa sp. PL04]